ncbi:hypothetical protein Dimus_037177 [Dionaea muscipula]
MQCLMAKNKTRNLIGDINIPPAMTSGGDDEFPPTATSSGGLIFPDNALTRRPNEADELVQGPMANGRTTTKIDDKLLSADCLGKGDSLGRFYCFDSIVVAADPIES